MVTARLMNNSGNLRISTAFVRVCLGVFACLFFAISLSACGGSDSVGQDVISCSFDDDCPLGRVCGPEKSCIIASCEFCVDDQVCYITPENPEGSCSRRECFSNSDCGDSEKICSAGLCVAETDKECSQDSDCGEDEVCNHAFKCVTRAPSPTSCVDSLECPEDHICNADNQCVADTPSQDEDCTTQGCSNDQVCNEETGQCEDNDDQSSTNCKPEDCEDNERCHPELDACVHDCVSDASLCEGNEYCDEASGYCQVDHCLATGRDPSQCGGSTPHWNQTFCACVACLDNDDCTGGRTCNSNGQCTASVCETPCDPNQVGQCGSPTPFCISGCCSECIGAADCTSPGHLCIDGFCSPPPNCADDPTVCPAGYECVNGDCKPPQTGQSCNPNDPASCPMGTFCDPASGQCQSPGGEFGCGLCNADCTCPGVLACDGFFCTGCAMVLFAGPGQACPAGQACWALGDPLGAHPQNFCGPEVF